MSKSLQLGKLPNHILKNLLKNLPNFGKEIIIPPGVGLDAAGLSIEGKLFAMTTDPITFTSKSIGKYAVCVNVNDIACLGCQPLWFSSVILLPKGTQENYLYELWHELNAELKEFGIQSIGGHCEVTEQVSAPVIVGQLIGKAVNEKFFDPREIKPGDKILLWRGVAIEGTALLAAERFSALSHYIMPAQLETMQSLIDEPGICIWPAAKVILDLPGVIALHDPTEGGVATALHEMADASGCGLQIEASKVPILSETQQLAEVLKFDPLGLLASGSLLIACRPEAEASIIARLKGERVGQLGEFIAENDRILYREGVAQTLPRFDQDELIKALKTRI